MSLSDVDRDEFFPTRTEHESISPFYCKTLISKRKLTVEFDLFLERGAIARKSQSRIFSIFIDREILIQLFSDKMCQDDFTAVFLLEIEKPLAALSTSI